MEASPRADGAPLVRLDSLDARRGARSFRFSGLRHVLRADRLEDVIPTLEAVEAAAAEGLHAVGFVAYEAAPAFDPALRTLPADPRLPLAWFAVYAHREEVAFTAEPSSEPAAPPESRHPEARPPDAVLSADGGRAEGSTFGRHVGSRGSSADTEAGQPLQPGSPAASAPTHVASTARSFGPATVGARSESGVPGPQDDGLGDDGLGDDGVGDDGLRDDGLGDDGLGDDGPGDDGLGDDGPGDDDEDFALGDWRIETPEDDYRRRVEEIRELIAAGDTYQVNYTVRMRAPFRGDPLALYRRLCEGQRSAFGACLDLGEQVILSASPELFFHWADGGLELRPMKGTRPRGRWVEEDDALAAELESSPKERAENLMIVDLLRNDAGRVSDFGSVRVERLFEVERYETVHQLTSTIRSRTRPGTTLTDVFRALFPCGSVTGAPKVRTSEIIAELEDEARSVYTGAIGFVSPGEAAFSVAIRTLLLDRAAGEVELGVGSGITFDSDAGAEYRECLAKAAFTRRAPADFRLLETLRWDSADGYFLLDGHLERLTRSAGYFGFRCEVEEVRARLLAAAAAEPEGRWRVRLTLGRSGDVDVACEPLVESPGPVRMAVSAEAVDSADPLLYHKTTRRDLYERAAALHPECDDVLLVNERGELTQSTIANLVVDLDGTRWTPPLESGLLPGVFRAELLRRGEIRERILRPDDLQRADAVGLVSSVRGWRRALVKAVA